jgi:hypothetical protein
VGERRRHAEKLTDPTLVVTSPREVGVQSRELFAMGAHEPIGGLLSAIDLPLIAGRGLVAQGANQPC